MILSYQIKLLSDWHVGSGLDAGPSVDLQVLKDANQLPFIPGKTIKGLLKDALLDINDLPQYDYSMEIDLLFGKPTGERLSQAGKLVFSNAVLPPAEREEIVAHQLSGYLYRQLSSTSIERKSGVAQKGSLRTLETCRPLVLEGEIEGEIDKTEKAMLLMTFQWLRHLGMQRNRGLGRCQFSEKTK